MFKQLRAPALRLGNGFASFKFHILEYNPNVRYPVNRGCI